MDRETFGLSTVLVYLHAAFYVCDLFRYPFTTCYICLYSTGALSYEYLQKEMK